MIGLRPCAGRVPLYHQAIGGTTAGRLPETSLIWNMRRMLLAAAHGALDRLEGLALHIQHVKRGRQLINAWKRVGWV